MNSVAKGVRRAQEPGLVQEQNPRVAAIHRDVQDAEDAQIVREQIDWSAQRDRCFKNTQKVRSDDLT